MATEFNRPTIPELLARIQADIEAEVTGVTARLRRRFERAVAGALAFVSHGLHGHLAWVADQIFPDTAVERILLRWCSLFGVTRKAAERAQGSVTVTGSGGDMLEGRRWVNPITGLLYETLADAEDITSETVQFRAVAGGLAGNLEQGTALNLVTPLTGVDGTATVGVGGLTGGTDLESLALLLERLIDRIQRPPMGGAPGDHVTWAEEVAVVTRAWEYVGVDGVGNPGLGQTTVIFVNDNAEDIIPSADDVEEVQLYLDDRSPDEVTVIAPTAVPLVAVIALRPNTEVVRTAVKAEIQDLIARAAEPGGTLPLSQINEAISEAEGEVDHELTSPVANVETDFGELTTFDTDQITFTTLV